MGWVITRWGFFFCLLLSLSGIEARDCAGIISSQSLAPADYALINAYRVRNAKIIYSNIELLRNDFPELKEFSEEKIHRWILDHFAFVTEFANDNTNIHHTEIDVDPAQSQTALVPHTYGRAFIMQGPSGKTVDLKGTGVTYVTKSEGKVVLEPKSVRFSKDAHHQDGLMKMREALYEVCFSNTLECANRIYFIIDIGAHLLNEWQDPAVLIGRQPNIRFYRLSPEEAEEARRKFLFLNATFFWKGLFHGSLNRYNAEKGRYIDFGTATGVPDRSYRLTAMSFVPYGLSDFYGLFGEWSAGQVCSDKNCQSPFYPRSWGLFLANIAVVLGFNEEKTYAFAQKEKSIPGPDLHELLLQLNARRPEAFRSDPSGKSFSKMHLISLHEYGVTGGEELAGLLDTSEIYRHILKGAKQSRPSSPLHYESLLRLASQDVNAEALKGLAEKFVEVEAMVRREIGDGMLLRFESERIGEQFLRMRVHKDSSSENTKQFLTKYERRLPKAWYLERSSSEKLGVYIKDWSRSGAVASQWIGIENGNVDRDLPIVTMNPYAFAGPQYRFILQNSIGLIWRDTTAAGEQFGHSYLRVGEHIFDLQVASIMSDNFLRTMKNRFFYNFGMLGRSQTAPYYEVIYYVSNKNQLELLRYLEDRAAGKATIDRAITIPHFSVDGNGDRWHDGIIRENCGAFATSFNHPHWWHDYPGLERVTEQTGLLRRMDGATIALQSLFDAQAKPLALFVWGGKSNHDILWFTGIHHHAEVLQSWPLTAEQARFQNEAERSRRWATEHKLTGYQAIAFPSFSKSGNLTGEPHVFNVIRLESKAIRPFADFSRQSLTLWWRWEPDGYGHSWISIGDKMYDQGFASYGRWNLAQFFEQEAENGFRHHGNSIFFVGLQMEVTQKEIEALETFFEARIGGKKADGTSIPMPAYDWQQPIVKDKITAGRCGMFSTSFANPAWQNLFPELPLAETVDKYGFEYADGSLFLLHRHFHHARAPKNFFVMGAEEHMRKETFKTWNLPTDSLPDEVREPMRGAWIIGKRMPF